MITLKINRPLENVSDQEKCTKIISRKKERCKHNLFKEGLCKLHYNKIHKEVLPILIHDGATKECSDKTRHKRSGSRYSREKVPIENFFKSEGKELYSTCIDCRKKKNEKKNELIQSNEKQKDSNFGVCCSDCHNDKISNFPRETVPISMFSLGVKGKSLECSDCREYHNKLKKEAKQKRKELAKENNQFFCTTCSKVFNLQDRAINLDATPSSVCIKCKEKMNQYNKKTYASMKSILTNIKLEKIYESECSCQECKFIYLQPEIGTNYQVELPTYQKNGERYVDYKNEIYLAKEFLIKFKDVLELRTIDLDHLNEREQRERGIISPDDPYIKKRGKVSDMLDEVSARQEAKITQNLCCKCHVIVTILREKGEGNYTHLYLEKMNYVNSLRSEGCEICKFFDATILRYFEFDHIDPKEKIAIISDMIRKKEYSIEQLIEECKKCRVLCRACHRIHTSQQKKDGII
jgi:hypothetical protein